MRRSSSRFRGMRNLLDAQVQDLSFAGRLKDTLRHAYGDRPVKLNEGGARLFPPR